MNLILAERDEIHSKFSASILDMQQKSGLKYMVLEKKITAMREEMDIKDAQMHEIVKVSQASDRGIIRYYDILQQCICLNILNLCE